MKILDLAPEPYSLYLQCLEDWSDEMKDAGNKKDLWFKAMEKNGLRVKLAANDDGVVGGMIQYIPIERSHVEGDGLYFISCIWVHGHKQGRGDFQKRGMGAALLNAAEEDARALGAKGIAAWGLSLPFWMKASWFKKHGYVQADKDGIAVLLWKRFSDDAEPPRWIKQVRKPVLVPGKVAVTSFVNGWCPAQNIVYERAKRASAEFGDAVVFTEIGTMDKATMREWGLSDALFIDGKFVRTGPPPSYEKIRKLIGTRVKKLKAGYKK
ncbi:MAG: GNAT family N-acetyltransferase [Euryarchaeota archaeon]|nr:GNAT family N-acetyltransferase [Euryarchaeota archaeon]